MSALVLCVFLAVLVVFLVWPTYRMLPDYIQLLDRTIVKRNGDNTEQMRLANLSAVKFHYHAVIGFIAVWEFVEKGGKSILVDANARGIKDLLASLAEALPGFFFGRV